MRTKKEIQEIRASSWQKRMKFDNQSINYNENK